MKDIRINFFKRRDWKRGTQSFFMLLMCFSFLFGCGGENPPASDRLSGPAADAVLPIRIDATVTPTLTPTPEPEDSSEENSFADMIQTPTIDSREEALLTPTTSPTSSEESTGSETAKDNVLPDPSPVPTPPPSPTDDSSSSSEESSKKTLKNPKNQSKPKKSENIEHAESSQDEDESEQEEVESEQSEEQDAERQSEESEKASKAAPVKSTNITLDQLEVCAKVSNRTPVNIGSEFSLSEVGKVYTWMRVSGVTPTKVLKHIYYREGKLIAKVSLKLKYTSMRTWSQKTFKAGESVGKWKVAVTTQDEKEVLAVKEFTVVP